MYEVAIATVLLLAGSVGFTFLVSGFRRDHEIETLSVANIASDMPERVNPHLTKNSTIRIVGGNGYYAVAKPEWPDTLEGWAREQKWVHYLLVNPTKDAEARLSALAGKYKNRFEAKVIEDPDSMGCSAEQAERIRSLRTFHFVVFEHPAQLWVERNHQPKETKAFDCEHVPPPIADRDPRLEEYRRSFDTIWDGYARPVAPETQTVPV